MAQMLGTLVSSAGPLSTDVLSNLTYYFGDDPAVVPQRGHDCSEHCTFHFPDSCEPLSTHPHPTHPRHPHTLRARVRRASQATPPPS